VKEKFSISRKAIEEIVIIIVLVGVGIGTYHTIMTYRKLDQTKEELTLRTKIYEYNIQKLRGDIRNLEDRLAELKSENDSITATLSDRERANLELEREKRRQEDEIEELTKLTTIDPELLKKYSKVYFLSENYVPRELTEIPKEYLSAPERKMQVLSDVWPYLEDMLEDAKRDNVTILISSAYRSFLEQKSLKSSYVVQYGSTTANRFSAEQGYSEHQLGTTLDFSTSSLKGALPGFDSTTAFKWLTENAHRYGFILSYPKNNLFYKYEPWHWRFVGKDLARDLNEDGKYFYEWDQRDIDEYLIEIFD
jgi:D-alanyl-D-alanine carboxypeptidase